MSSTLPIAENDSYVLYREFEDVFLFDKDLNKELWRTSLYGEAQCALLGEGEDWAVIGGHVLIVWIHNKITTIDDVDLKWIHDLRQVDDFEIEILIDPWSETPAIWRFNVLSQEKYKLQDFNTYKNKPYTENVIW